MRSILESLPAERQTAMFSATWPEEVQELAEEFAGDYTFMNIGSTELSANKDIRQKVLHTTSTRLARMCQKKFTRYCSLSWP